MQHHSHMSEMDASSMSDSSSMQHNHMSHQGEDHQAMDHSMMHMGNLKLKFVISLILAIPIILLSPMMGINLPFSISFNGSEWLVLILATILYFYGGMPFLSGAKMELSMKKPAMMTLIALGISVSYFYSLYAFIQNNILVHSQHVMDFFWELATLIVIMLLGHWIEMNAVAKAGNAVQKIAALLPNEAKLIDAHDNITKVPLKAVKAGQKLLVSAGDKVPTDGIITSGTTTINEAMVTGEAKAIEKQSGDKVIGGSTNGSGTITIKVTATGEAGYLSQVMQLVKNAQKDKSKMESLSDKVAKYLFYIAVSVGLITFIAWLLIDRNVNTALERMVTVLIIACPHALGLAIPLVTARSTSLGAQNGLLIKNRKALEQASKVNMVMMDKTGTLTEGEFSVTAYQSFNQNYHRKELLALMAALEKGSAHPLALGIIRKAEQLNLNIPTAENLKNIAGVGISGQVNGQEMKIVNARYLKQNNIEYNQAAIEALAEKGNSISFLLVGKQAIGLVAQGDEIKPEAKQTIYQFNKMGIKPVMLTGDNASAAKKIADLIGIDTFEAELKPEDKEKIVHQYQDKGNVVMMVGDGINDAPSLVRANIGIAIGAGTDIAVDSADVILVKSNPHDIVQFLKLAKHTTSKMKQNLWWGAGYNIIAIPLAAGILAFAGIVLSPALGAILMSLSTIIVAINALLLRID
ncbi:copper-translocating P-type ATPase [Enterococcus sp. MMGLQ5-2]|nr:copper-translocating P-type ATPase [Enterococcus sp. MMGLQ5-1]NPD35873.1 copper-translocating P-type ATPase [Enterococcus sp. MMGLQ5-2]